MRISWTLSAVKPRDLARLSQSLEKGSFIKEGKEMEFAVYARFLVGDMTRFVKDQQYEQTCESWATGSSCDRLAAIVRPK